MEEQTGIESKDWRENLTSNIHPKMKILSGETKTFTFLDEGSPYKHPDFDECIIFTVKVDGSKDDKNTWFVNKQAYGLLRNIRDLGKLTNLKVALSRTGEKKSDTRYNLVKAEEDQVPTLSETD